MEAVWGSRGSANFIRLVQESERDKPEGGRWAVGRGWLEGRVLPAQGELPGLNSHALFWDFG